MPRHVRSYQNANRPIVDAGDKLAENLYFNLLRLSAGQRSQAALEGFESVYVVLSGRCDIQADDEVFTGVGGRKDVWSGMADSVYVPPGVAVTVSAAQSVELAVAGARWQGRSAAFRVRPEEVETVEVGSVASHSRRRICHILGQNAGGRAGRLLVSERFTDPGCWSGYPPHKHDQDIPGQETAFQELYHFRYRPVVGAQRAGEAPPLGAPFGLQLVFQDDGTADCYMTGEGDCVLIERGYHPGVTSPGHEEYALTVMAGQTQRSLVQHFHGDHRWLMQEIPGIQAMRDKFR